MKYLIVTNNPLTREKFRADDMIYLDGAGVIETLTAVRNETHKGRRILTHPLSGSIKPNESPYKTVVMSGNCGGLVDLSSLELIENAIFAAQKLMKCNRPAAWPKPILEDFQLIDYDLIRNAISNTGG